MMLVAVLIKQSPRPLKSRLLGSHTASQLAEVLFEVWKCATEEQFTWFVGTFEAKMQLKNERFFNAALNQFTV